MIEPRRVVGRRLDVLARVDIARLVRVLGEAHELTRELGELRVRQDRVRADDAALAMCRMPQRLERCPYVRERLVDGRQALLARQLHRVRRAMPFPALGPIPFRLRAGARLCRDRSPLRVDLIAPPQPRHRVFPRTRRCRRASGTGEHGRRKEQEVIVVKVGRLAALGIRTGHCALSAILQLSLTHSECCRSSIGRRRGRARAACPDPRRRPSVAPSRPRAR